MLRRGHDRTTSTRCSVGLSAKGVPERGCSGDRRVVGLSLALGVDPRFLHRSSRGKRAVPDVALGSHPRVLCAPPHSGQGCLVAIADRGEQSCDCKGLRPREFPLHLRAGAVHRLGSGTRLRGPRLGVHRREDGSVTDYRPDRRDELGRFVQQLDISYCTIRGPCLGGLLQLLTGADQARDILGCLEPRTRTVESHCGVGAATSRLHRRRLVVGSGSRGAHAGRRPGR